MNPKSLIYFLFMSGCAIIYSQPSDTIYGKVKSVREQLSFLDGNRQNAKLSFNDGDYGHNGFMSPRRTKAQFYNWWYHTDMVHYVNYYKDFNEKGQPTYETWFNKNGDTIRTYQYRYDREDHLIEVRQKWDDDKYSIDQYHYDYKGRLKTEIYISTYPPFYYGYSEYLYNDQDQLAAERSFDQDGESTGLRYSYDSKGRKTKKILHSQGSWIKREDGVTSFERDSIGFYRIQKEYSYNEAGELIEVISYGDNNDNKYRSDYYQREKNGYEEGLLKRIEYISNNNPEKEERLDSYRTYEYDQDRRLLREAYTGPNFIHGTTLAEYSYNSDGNLIKLVYTFDNQTTTATFEYEFDAQKNWVKQVKSLDGEKLFVWTRKIEYY